MIYPIDLMKTIIQGDRSEVTLRQKDILKKIINDKGYLSLYKGMTTCVTRAFFVNGVFFYVNETCSIYLKQFI